MQGIFVRIYAAFLITSLFAALVTLTLAIYYRQWSNDSINLIAPTGGYISAAELMLQRGGEPLLMEWLLRFERHPSVNAYVFDHQGISLLADIPADVHDYAFAADSFKARVNPLGQTEVLVKAPIQDRSGNIYLLVVEFLHPLAVFNLPVYIAWGLFASLLLMGILGFIVSRYLSQPLLSLRESVKAFADGRWPDISQQVLSRGDEVGDLGREFDRMAGRLQMLISGQQQLLSDVSHELRSPLARIVVAIELARLDAVPAQEEHLARIELETQRLNELIADLLGMARLEADEAQQAWKEVDCSDVVRQVVTDARFEHPENDISLTLEADRALVSGDARLLASAVENLLRNALLHTHAGTAVEVTLRVQSGHCDITVRDHGPGVAEDMLEELLKPFVRNEEARERSQQNIDKGHRGFGLGLAIA